MNSSVDIGYKQLFSHPETVRDLVAGFLSADWAQALTVDALERVNASYASEQGRVRHEDVVWRAFIGGEWVYVYILLEFQSRPDKWMALRMQVYIGLLYQDLVAQHKLSKHGRLPPVVPIVLYHGRRPWRAAIELRDLLLPPPDGLERFQAGQRYMLIDQYHDCVRGNLVGLLFRLRLAATDTEKKIAWMALSMRLGQQDLAPARASIDRWLLLTLREEAVDPNIEPEENTTMRTETPHNSFITEELIRELLQPREEALQEGIKQGVQQGVQQGELRALREVLNDLLEDDGTRNDVATKIAGADSTQLRAWIKSLIGGASPRQLFAEG